MLCQVRIDAVHSGFTLVSSLKAGVSIMNAFPGCDLASALSVCQLAALKRLKQSGSLPRIKGRGVTGETRVEEGRRRRDLSTSRELFLGKQPLRNEPNGRLAHIVLQTESAVFFQTSRYLRGTSYPYINLFFFIQLLKYLI